VGILEIGYCKACPSELAESNARSKLGHHILEPQVFLTLLVSAMPLLLLNLPGDVVHSIEKLSEEKPYCEDMPSMPLGNWRLSDAQRDLLDSLRKEKKRLRSAISNHKSSPVTLPAYKRSMFYLIHYTANWLSHNRSEAVDVVDLTLADGLADVQEGVAKIAAGKMQHHALIDSEVPDVVEAVAVRDLDAASGSARAGCVAMVAADCEKSREKLRALKRGRYLILL
jgi:hypothetical protein